MVISKKKIISTTVIVVLFLSGGIYANIEKLSRLTKNEFINNNKKGIELDEAFEKKQMIHISENMIDSLESKENIIFSIDDFFDLGGKKIKIAKGSILKFNGGGLSNGTIIGQKTRIVAPFGKIFSTSLCLEGEFLSDKILMSWWKSDNVKDNTEDVQAALNSITSFSNRVFCFDVPVKITDVSYTLKWCPGVKFEGLCNSNQGSQGIYVYGKDSRGFDISATEQLQFDNILFCGDEADPPLSLLFASRFLENKQCPNHTFANVTFCGNITESLVYNYSGESWDFFNCKFKLSEKVKCHSAYYGTTTNERNIKSKFGRTEDTITPLTCTDFRHCFFINLSNNPSIIFEGGENINGRVKNIASICFQNCYFYTPLNTTAQFINVYGGISFSHCIDESGADSNAKGSNPFYMLSGYHLLNCLSFNNNTIYARQNCCIVDAHCPIINYTSASNYVVNSGAIWRFSELYHGKQSIITANEKFEVTGTHDALEIESTEKNRSNIIIDKK